MTAPVRHVQERFFLSLRQPVEDAYFFHSCSITGAMFHAHTVHTANSRYYDTSQADKKAVSHYHGINAAPRSGRHFAVCHNERRPHFIQVYPKPNHSSF
jgi:hypothetical protein